MQAAFKSDVTLARIGQPEEIVSVALFLASDEASFVLVVSTLQTVVTLQGIVPNIQNNKIREPTSFLHDNSVAPSTSNFPPYQFPVQEGWT